MSFDPRIVILENAIRNARTEYRTCWNAVMKRRDSLAFVAVYF